MKKRTRQFLCIFSILMAALIAVPGSAALCFASAAPAGSASEEEPPRIPVKVYTSGDYSYSINKDETITIEDYSGEEKDLEIPERIDGYSVSAIGSEVFSYVKVNTLKIPEGVASIGSRAFEYCVVKDSIEIPAGVTIGHNAFSYAELPVELTIPEKAVLGNDTFAYLENTKLLYVEPETVLSSKAFNYSRDLEAVIIAPKVTVEDRAFEYCDYLAQVILCGDVTINGEPFKYCDLLKITNVPEDVYLSSIAALKSGLKTEDPGTMHEYSIGDMSFAIPYEMESSKMPGYDLFLMDADIGVAVGGSFFPEAYVDLDDEEAIKNMLTTSIAAIDGYHTLDVSGYPALWVDTHSDLDGTAGVYLYVVVDGGMYYLMYMSMSGNTEEFSRIAGTVTIQ